MLTKKPKKPLPSWPPLYHAHVHEVKEGDNWWKLAEDYGRKDPWDIIQYNFNTKDPEEVNYYLAELVGCRKSKDGKNYSFSSEDKPGKVYIPPPQWVPAFGPYLKRDWKEEFMRTEGYVYEFGVDTSRLRQVVDQLEFVEDPQLSTPWEYDYGTRVYVRPARLFTAYPWNTREIVHVLSGPLGQGKAFCAETDAKAWAAAEFLWSDHMPKVPFPLSDARGGFHEKLKILQAARVYRQMRGTFAEAQRFRELMMVVRRDPDYQRRLARGSRRVA